MRTFPMFLQMAGRRVVIVGGGEQAVQKARLMLKTEAEVVVLARDLEPELANLAAQGQITHIAGRITTECFVDCALCFVATGCPGNDMALHALAKCAGAIVNTVDQPALCDALTPSIVDRDPVVVAIGTEGTAPVLARQIKTKIEGLLEPRLGELAASAGRLRWFAAARLAPRRRRDLWRWVFNGKPRHLFAGGAERAAIQLIKSAIEADEFAGSRSGSVSIIDAGPGDRDLITLRGVQRLQEADVIYYDEQHHPAVLELARRDAQRVEIGAVDGCADWPADKLCQSLLAKAAQGERVVLLDQGLSDDIKRRLLETAGEFGQGVSIENVPGVSSRAAPPRNGAELTAPTLQARGCR